MQRPSLVLFDCDGVLVDSEPIAASVLRDYLDEQGLPLLLEEVDLRYRGRSLSDCRHLVEAELGRPLPEDFVTDLNERTFAGFRAGLQPIPGVRELIEALLDAKVALCVASSGGLEKIRFTLGHTGLLHFFEPNLFSASMVRRGKPHPDLFLHAAQVMGFAPSACLVIEDSVPGATGALAARMRTIGYSPEEDPGLAATGAEIATSMGSVQSLLGL